MSDISKLVSTEEPINFIIDGEEKSLSIKELSIRERENFNNKLICGAKTLHVKKINEVASGLIDKEKIDYMVAATNSMPNFEEQLGALIFSNEGIRTLLKVAIKESISDKDIDSILDNATNGDCISKVIKKALKLGNYEVIDSNTEVEVPLAKKE